ncbi:hypothetical protein [Variovorax sp. LG9.2]|uniref:hypothetical protein n=1 Tax=Variovorax sp. LG9.2 TaxID=3048626 RepID=UPI002B22797C|nr:hypothetical protein [Variovorax sp. LG9.2]MEB0057286.1 hypothetical protein [Variovorax sp. LG9.2]
MAATEEETFRLLKRTPFKDVLEAMNGMTTKRKGDLILKKHNWTPDEFLAKCIELIEASVQQYIKDNPQPKG